MWVKMLENVSVGTMVMQKNFIQPDRFCGYFRKLSCALVVGLILPTTLISQVDLVIERETGDIIFGWKDGGVLQMSTELAGWKTMLNTPSPFRLAHEEQLRRQFFSSH